jgi:hypothetical protein
MQLTIAKDVKDRDCPVATIDVVGSMTSRDRIEIVDYGPTVVENAPAFHRIGKNSRFDNSDEFVFNEVFASGVPDDFVILTDKAASGTIEAPETPLFYTYELKFDVYSSEPQGDIRLYDGDEKIIPQSWYTLEYGVEPLYHDGLPKRYSEDITWRSNPDNTLLYNRVRILMPLSAATRGSIRVFYTAYQLGDSIPNHWEYVNPRTLYTPTVDWEAGTSGIATTADGDLENSTLAWAAVSPDAIIRTTISEASAWEPWYIRVHQGAFHVSDGRSHGEGSARYSVIANERETEDDANDKSKSVREVATRIDSTTIRLSNTPLVIDASGITPYPWYRPHILRDSGDETVGRHSGSPSGIAIYFGDDPIEQQDIIDWDERNGLVRLRKKIPTSQPVRSTYLHERRWHIIRTADMNPSLSHFHFNKENDFIENDGIRVVITPSGALGWHYTSTNPSGMYSPESTGFTTSRPLDEISLASGVLIADASVKPYRVSEVITTDIRRQGGSLNTTDIEEDPENIWYMGV